MSTDLSLGRAVLVLSTDSGEYRVGLDQAQVHLSGLKKEAAATGGSLSGVGSLLKKAFAVTAIVAAGKATLDYAGTISDLSKRLSISTSTAQEWDATFGQAGVELGTVAKATEELTNRIIGGDKSATAALKKLGFSLQELKAMKPDERFIAVADAVGRVQDAGERLYASKALFGKGGAELLQALDGNLGATIQRMRDLGMVIDEDTIAAADEFGDQIGVMGKQLMALLATVLAPLLPLLSQVGNVMMWLGANVIGPVLTVAVKGLMTALASLWQTISSVLARAAELGAKLPGVGGKFQELAAWLRQSSDASGKYIERLWVETDHVAASATAAVPKVLGFGEEVERTGKKADKAAKDQDRWNESIQAATEKAGLSTFALHRWGGITIPAATAAIGDNRDEILAWVPALDSAADVTGDLSGQLEELQRAGRHTTVVVADLNQRLQEMPARVQTAAEAYRASVGEMSTSTSTLGQHIGGFFQNIPAKLGELQSSLAGKLSGMFGAKPDSLMASVVSGGLNFVFGPLSGLATQILQKGMEALGAVVWKGLQKIGGFFKNMFGGPSASELAGRDLVKEFASNLAAMFSDQQRVAAGGEEWKTVVIGLRDQYAELGLTAEEALRDAERLLASSRDGAEATRRVIEEIQRKLAGGITVPVHFDVDVPPQLGRVFPEGDLGGDSPASAAPALVGGGTTGDLAFSRRGLFGPLGGGGTAVIQLNGRTLAEAVVPEMPGVVQRYTGR